MSTTAKQDSDITGADHGNIQSSEPFDAPSGSHSSRAVSLTQHHPSTLLPLDLCITLLSDMLLGRRFEDKCAEMYYRGKMFGFVHLYNGQEAVSTGVIKSMKSQYDWFCSTYRDHVHALSCGVPPKSVMSELFGKSTGCSKGRGGSMHLFSRDYHLLGGFAFIGEGIPVALGSAFTSMYHRLALGDPTSDAVTAAFFGDGTCNIGQFFECLNMAQLWKLPILFVVENTSGPSEWTTTEQLVNQKYGAKHPLLGCTVKRLMEWMSSLFMKPPNVLSNVHVAVKAPHCWNVSPIAFVDTL